MKFKADEIASVLQKEIEDFRGQLATSEVGRVLEVGDGIAALLRPLHGHGRRNGRISQRRPRPGLQPGRELASASSSWATISKSPKGTRSRRPAACCRFPSAKRSIGRVVDPLGNPLDGKGPIVTNERRPVETIAPGVAARQPVKQPLQTGIKAIDAMTPIGRGQRELIIGDRKTGKTAVAIDTIINQKGGDVICIYVACGQRASATAGVVEVLREHGALDYTIVVSATASDPAPLQYVAPYAGAAMAEYFMWQGKHTLVIYDDLSKQAQAYRQLSLSDAAAPRTRGVSRRRLLLPQPPARAGLQAQQ